MRNILLIGPTSTIAKSYLDHNKKNFNNIVKFSLSNNTDLVRTLEDQIRFKKFDSVLYFGHKKGESFGFNDSNSRFINVELPIKLAQICQAFGSQFLVFSSTRIFNEKESFVEKKTKYSPETDYGQQKVDLERGVLQYNSKVLRLTKVVTPLDELWLNWHKSITTGAKSLVYRDKFISPIFLKEVVEAIDIVLQTKNEYIFQLSRDKEISFESLFEKFLEVSLQNGNILVDKGGVEFVNGVTTHSSLECDSDLKQCIGEFDFQFEEFISNLF